MARKQSSEERSIRCLIRRYTKKRDWDMVRALFLDLGSIFEEETV